jgi:hypothetical protein
LPVDPLVRRWLREEEIETTADLWQRIGPDFRKGLDEVARETRIDRPLLLPVLGAGLAQEKRWRPSLREMIAALLLLALGLLAVLRIAEAAGLATFPVPALAVSEEQVVLKGDVPAFRVITPNDLGLKKQPRTEKGLTNSKKAVGHYLLRPLHKGDVLHAGDVGSGGLPGHWILTLNLPSARLGPLVEPGSSALLILSPRRRAAPEAVEAEALILDVRRNGETALVTLAVPVGKKTQIAAALATSEVFFSTTTP